MSGRGKSAAPGSGARTLARRLALKALYRWQLNACPWQDLVQEFATDPDGANADTEYFHALVQGVCEGLAALDAELAPLLDRPAAQLDPIEHAVLLIGVFELQRRPDVPFRVVIDEAVILARRYGATDGHKFINGVLDRGARLWRPEAAGT